MRVKVENKLNKYGFFHKILIRKTDSKVEPSARRCMHNINLQCINTFFPSFDQNIAEFYKQIILTVFCILWAEFWLKPRYFGTENVKVFKTLPYHPLIYDITLTVLIAR